MAKYNNVYGIDVSKKKLDEFIKQYDAEMLSLLCSIKGIGKTTAIALIIELMALRILTVQKR